MVTSLLDSRNTGMVVVDMQEKLIPLMGRRERLVDNMITLLRLAGLFKIPLKKYDFLRIYSLWQDIILRII